MSQPQAMVQGVNYGNNGVNTTGKPDPKDYTNYQTNQNAIAEAEKVRQDRLNAGMDVTQQDAWLENLRGQQNNPNYFMGGMAQNMYDSLNADNEMELNNTLAEYQKAYQEQVMNGNLSLREAERLYKSEVEALNANALANNQNAKNALASRGIQDSMMGIATNMHTEAQRTKQYQDRQYAYNSKVLDIKERMNNLKSQLDIDTANAKNNFALADKSAKAKVMGQYMEMMGKMSHDIFMSDKEFDNNMKRLKEEAKLQAERDAKLHGYDLEKMDKEFENEWKVIEYQARENRYLTQLQMSSRGGGGGYGGGGYGGGSEEMTYDEMAAEARAAEKAYFDSIYGKGFYDSQPPSWHTANILHDKSASPYMKENAVKQWVAKSGETLSPFQHMTGGQIDISKYTQSSKANAIAKQNARNAGLRA